MRLVTSSLRALIGCLPWRDDQSLTVVIVAGHDGNETSGMMEEQRHGMRGGVLK